MTGAAAEILERGGECIPRGRPVGPPQVLPARQLAPHIEAHSDEGLQRGGTGYTAAMFRRFTQLFAAKRLYDLWRSRSARR